MASASSPQWRWRGPGSGPDEAGLPEVGPNPARAPEAREQGRAEGRLAAAIGFTIGNHEPLVSQSDVKTRTPFWALGPR